MPSASLNQYLPQPGAAEPGTLDEDALLDGFLGYVQERGLELYPAQEEALLALFSGNHVVLNTPTGSGKSLVAAGAHFMALAQGRRSFYTAPIKALVNEKFFDLCSVFGAESVGLMTGDASVNADAPIICCTAEVLANLALRTGVEAPVDLVVMDEFHFYSDRERGVAWQIPLLTLPHCTFLLMSATLGDTSFFEQDLTQRTGREAALVKSAQRPVPLDFTYRETPLHETIQELVETERAPIYIVHFTQRAAAEQAQSLMSSNFLTREQKNEVNHAMRGFRFDSPFGKELRRFLHHGVGLHHAGLLPKYRRLVETLAQRGLLTVICGTDTLGVGVNVPIRTVLFTRLCKYDGQKTKILSVREFKQISGRAGRKGFDEAGSVVVQAPEHVIENKVLRQKAQGDAKKMRKLVARKPPERGYAHWDEPTFQRLVGGEPEALESRFQLSHALLLNVLSRGGPQGCRALKELVRGCHDSAHLRTQHRKFGMQLFRSLVDAGVVRLNGPEQGGVQLSEDLQDDFSLNQALSLFVLHALGELDAEAEGYPLHVVSLVEAVLEQPDIVLRKQVDRLKTEALAEMKQAGMEYDERMEELEKIDYPKPDAEFIYATFNAFRAERPWIGTENIRPKSIVRDMYETAAGFGDYVKDYGLQRYEGVLLRYLSNAYKAIAQTVPEADKTEGLHDLLDWLYVVVRQVDSSLLDEWEAMRSGSAAAELKPAQAVEPDDGATDITRDPKNLRILADNTLWRLVLAVARRDYDAAAAQVATAPTEPTWTGALIGEQLAAFWEDHERIEVHQAARARVHMRLREGGTRWDVERTLVDPEGDHEWFVEGYFDLEQARQDQALTLVLIRIRTT